MPDDPELQRIISNGIANGYSDDDIRLLVAEHKRRQPAATQPAAPVDRIAQALMFDTAAQTETAKQVGDILTAGPQNIVEGAGDVTHGDVAKGARKIVKGGAQTVAVLAAPAAVSSLVTAPVATLAAAGGGAAAGTVAGNVAESGAKALGATDDQAGLVGDVAALGGGGVGARITAKATTAIGRGLTEVLPEKLYGQIFKTAEEDIRRAYIASANGRLPEPSLARKAIEEGVMGSPEKMAVYSLEKLHGLEQQLQAKAGREIIILPDKDKYVSLLESLANQFKGGFFSPRADDALKLVAELKSIPGPNAKASAMLSVRRYLDGLRNTSSFKVDPTLTQKQEELKIAADQIRATLHKRPALSPLIDRERTFIRALDAVVDDAVKRGNRQVFGLVDAVLTQAGPSGAGAAIVRHGAMMPSVMTGLAQALTKSGRMTGAAVPLMPSHATTLGAVSAEAGR